MVIHNDILFATIRPTAQRPCIIPIDYDHQICSTGFCVLRVNTRKVIPKYVYYFLQTHTFQRFITIHQKGSLYSSISNSDIKSFPIPLSPLPAQQGIINMLDSVCDPIIELTENMVTELTLRQQQYEYYVNILIGENR